MNILGLETCGPSLALKIILYAKEFVNIIKFLIPIGLILMVSIDFTKNVISGNENETKKNLQIAIKRILYAVVIFLIPSFVDTTMNLLDQQDFSLATCYANVTKEGIESIVAMEEQEKKIDTYDDVDTPNHNRAPITEISGTANLNSSGCDGLIYYENGVFYKPSSSEHNGREKSKGTGEYNYNKYFWTMLKKMTDDAKAQGYNITPGNTIELAWRSYEEQVKMKARWEARGEPNKAAEPGTSNHGLGIASDLIYISNVSDCVNWILTHGKEYGIHLNLIYTLEENWHVEPINLVTDDEKVKKCL